MFNGQNFHAGPDGADTGVATVHLLKGQVGKLIVPAQAGMDVAVFGDDAIGHIRLGVKGPNNVGGEAVEARVGVDERIYGALSRHRAPEHGQHPAGRVHVRVGRARMDDGEEESHVSHIMDNNLIIAGPQGVSTVVTIPLQTLRGFFGCCGAAAHHARVIKRFSAKNLSAKTFYRRAGGCYANGFTSSRCTRACPPKIADASLRPNRRASLRDVAVTTVLHW